MTAAAIARKIVVAIRKGGSGKTTTAVNLAGALMLLGKRVLLVDLDSQGNATRAMGVSRDEIILTVRDILAAKATNLKDAVVTRAWSEYAQGRSLDVLPSHEKLGNTEMGMAVQTALAQLGMGDEPVDTMQSIANLLRFYETSYDYIIIDTAPNPGPLTLAALSAGDDMLIPYEMGAFNDDGLIHAFKTARDVQLKSNPNLTIHGILFTMTDNTLFSKESMDDMKQYEGHIYPFRVPRRTLYNWANNNGVPAIVARPSDDATRPYMQLAEAFING
ncbi:ParA family protein [Streptomyces turgidiscabies]|uniref:ParA family protein n=1 Tax=Streptomyces TaxID=1883 RepID=UPI00076F05C7|nr:MULTISPECIES: AAA family ATPase [Streptomyces]MDX3494549.1 AAA family ATPase [Streptomyces turgidiscabies]GAQ76417.1 sporulation initiation inhibitor protein Soj [Streptomyces turgidiscabies]